VAHDHVEGCAMKGLRPDEVDRTALIRAYDGNHGTLEDAIARHEATGVVLCADRATCEHDLGQAALLTAVVTAVRAFGQVIVRADAPNAVARLGITAGKRLAYTVLDQGAVLADDLGQHDWPVVLIGTTTPVPAGLTSNRVLLRVSWSGWTARVSPARTPHPTPTGNCVLAATAAAALGINEAFAATLARPGNDGGHRGIELNLWRPGSPTDDPGPALAYAPNAWWLVGLGHLGQAYAWLIGLLDYVDRAGMEIVLQDTDRTTPANHSTGIFTPNLSDGVRKTRMVAGELDNIGFNTKIIERRLTSDLQVAPDEAHVALLGVDNLATRRLTSDVGWPFAIDVGLGDGPTNYDSLMLRRFPGNRRSDTVPAWNQEPRSPATIPTTPVFTDLLRTHDQCGVVELAGKPSESRSSASSPPASPSPKHAANYTEETATTSSPSTLKQWTPERHRQLRQPTW
jgi:hypothetical protein